LTKPYSLLWGILITYFVKGSYVDLRLHTSGTTHNMNK